jgi:SpoVK/Ycf46/Vps4 family AAA+-type ATPase
VNSVDGIDEAILRRMSLVIPFNPPNAKVRAKIWEHHLQDKGIHDITPEEMAKTWAVSAGLGATAVHTAHIAGLGGKGINDILDGFSRVVGDLRAKDSDDIPDFDPEISETTEDLKTMVELLLSSRRKDWSMCLFGPSGTGKSAFARYVANALGMEVLLKRGSDLMDKYVGQTEKLIADAFAEARQGKKVLIMDEVDSMLMNRETATHSWEITKVNEMLTQMETHPFPFFATTNLMQDLDKAALRRFTFKMEFKEIPSHKMKRAFEKIIGLPAPEGIYWPARVSAGDLAVLKKRADILGITDARVIGRWIEEEVSIKTGGRAGRIGY